MNPYVRCSVAIVLLLGGGAAAAEEGMFYGMLRARDLSPFGFLRLDMRPAHAMAMETGTFSFETELGYQNTWALSRNVESYLTSLESGGRREIGPAEIDAILALPGENYLVDVESATLDMTVHYKISTQWSVYAIASALSYHGGFMDDYIEQFHQAFGFSSFGRPAARRNDTNLILDLKSTRIVMQDAPVTNAFTDPTFGLRYTGITLPAPWDMSFEVAAKVPLDGERLLFSTGHADYGGQFSLRRRGTRHAFYADFAAVYYAGERRPVRHRAQVVPTMVLGWEYKATARTNLNLQGYVSRSVYSRDETELDELLGEKFQLSLGVRHRYENFLFSFAATENLHNLNNTPDIAFQLGIAWIPEGDDQP